MSTRFRSQIRLRGALQTPQSEITISSVGLFSSLARSEPLDESHKLVTPETPHLSTYSLVETLECSTQQIYSAIIPPADSLVVSFE